MKDLLEFIDVTLAEKSMKAEKPRNYLGASLVGNPCERKIWYEYNGVPKSDQIDGKTWRIFGRGHTMETQIVRWLQKVGFEITDEEDGKQLGFKNEDIAGHIDGLVTKSPHSDVSAPCILEIKTVGNNSFKKMESKGIEYSRPEYYAQINLYMHFMGYTENPGMFVVLNSDNMKLYVEMIDYNESVVEDLLNKARKIKETDDVGHLGRMYEFYKNSFPCFWFSGCCSYWMQCKKDQEVEDSIEEK